MENGIVYLQLCIAGKKSRVAGQLVENDPLLAVINHRPEILQQMLQMVRLGERTFPIKRLQYKARALTW